MAQYRTWLKRVSPRYRHRGGLGNLSSCRDCGLLITLIVNPAYLRGETEDRGIWITQTRDGTRLPCAGQDCMKENWA